MKHRPGPTGYEVSPYERLYTVRYGLVGDGVLGEQVVGDEGGDVLDLLVVVEGLGSLLEYLCDGLAGEVLEVRQVRHVPVGRRHAGLDQSLGSGRLEGRGIEELE